MPRRSTGSVVVDTRRKSPVFALRFRAYGRREYVTLGSAEEGWTTRQGRGGAQNMLADVDRGIWRPADRGPRRRPSRPRIRRSTSSRRSGSRPTRAGGDRARGRLQWQLSNHLLPFFARHRLSQITIQEVDRYRSAKQREGMLSVTSINKTITRLAQILEVAVEYGMIERNPAKGKRRRVKARNQRLSTQRRARPAREDRQHVPRRLLATLFAAAAASCW